MFSAQKEVFIAAPPERVFALLADVERHSEWSGSGEVLRIRKLTEGSVGVGTRLVEGCSAKCVNRMLDMPMALPYHLSGRPRVIKQGIERTLENLRRLAEEQKEEDKQEEIQDSG